MLGSITVASGAKESTEVLVEEISGLLEDAGLSEISASVVSGRIQFARDARFGAFAQRSHRHRLPPRTDDYVAGGERTEGS